MTNSSLLQKNARSALAARDILSFTHRGAIAVLILMLLGVGMLTGSPSATAQESSTAVTPAVATATERVNINTADAPTLAANLKGIGESRAAEIVRYREAYGPFASAEELVEVKGIGNSTLEMNRDVITLE